MATKAEREHMAAVQALGCIACKNTLGVHSQAEIHHILSGGRRMGHMWVLGLCPMHHRGVGLTEAFRKMGIVAISDSVRIFERTYGKQLDLHAQVEAMLKGAG